jgi:hypothetical protein
MMIHWQCQPVTYTAYSDQAAAMKQFPAYSKNLTVTAALDRITYALRQLLIYLPG